MAKKTIIFLILAAVIVVGLFLLFRKNESAPPVEEPMVSADEQAVRAVVEEFGRRLKNVNLLFPTAASDIQTQYGEFISVDLLAAWQKEPAQAMGKIKDNQWPDRIEIIEIARQEDGAYDVAANVIEVTSANPNEIASQYSLTLKLRQREGKWIITGIVRIMAL